MGGLFCARLRIVKGWVVASLLLILTGCTTLPAPPAQPNPQSSSSSSAPSPLTSSKPGTASPPASPSKSRFSDFISRRFHKKVAPPVAAVEAEAPAAPDISVDEKYRLTGEAAIELERGHASWYGGQFQGRLTASGETYDKYALTAAHKTLPFGTIVRVRSVTLGREVDVRINDRGPFTPGRVIDVSRAAAEVLGLIDSGGGEVTLNVNELPDQATPAPRSSKNVRKVPRRQTRKVRPVRRR